MGSWSLVISLRPDLGEANLAGANLRGTDLDDANIVGATCDETTIFPEAYIAEDTAQRQSHGSTRREWLVYTCDVPMWSTHAPTIS
jgi:hypothetical protein